MIRMSIRRLAGVCLAVLMIGISACSKQATPMPTQTPPATVTSVAVPLPSSTSTTREPTPTSQVSTPVPTITPAPTPTRIATPTGRATSLPGDQTLNLSDVGPTTIDPALSQDARSHVYVVQVFSGLVGLNNSQEVAPEIADRWDISGDGTTYTFHIRSNAHFHNGKDVTAQDFKYSVERAADPATGSMTASTYLGDIVGVRDKLAGKAKDVAGVTVVDSKTIRLRIDSPKSYFLAKLTYPSAFALDKQNVESGKDWTSHANGTGPFKLAQWQPNKQIVLQRNDSYYLGPPRLSRVVFKLLTGVPLALYESGQIDVASIGGDDLAKAKDPASPFNKELKVFPELSVFFIGFNHTKPPFDDALVRRAFAMSLDGQRLLKSLLKGSAQEARGFLPPGIPGYNPNVTGVIFDAAKAKALMAQSRYGEISKLPPIALTTSGLASLISGAVEAAVANWRENLGVDITVRAIDPDVASYVLKTEKDQMFDFGWVADYPDPQDFVDILFRTGSQQNIGEYSNPKVDALLHRAGTENDEATRLKLYQQAEQMLVDDTAAIPLWFGRNYMLVKPYVENFAIDPLGLPELLNVAIRPH